MTYIGDYASPLGDMLMSSDGESLTGLWFMGQKYCGETLGPDLESKDDLRLFQNVRKWLDSYFAGQNPAAADLPLAPSGGRFP